MKKELLIASALVSTMGLAGLAEAASMSMSGNHRVGLTSTDSDDGTETRATSMQSSIRVAVSETTDGGTTISSGFNIANESTGAGGGNQSGLTLTFTDGSKLDLISAGNASGSHDVSIPSGGGEQGITVTSTNNAPTGLDFATSATGIGFEYHTAADTMIDGAKFSVSYSTDTGAASTATPVAQSHYAIGTTYVTSAGDTAVTIGAGYSTTDFASTGTAASNDESGVHFGLSAVTGNLTVAAGLASGDTVGATPSHEATGDIMKAGAKYVSGDLTFNIGITASSAKDSATLGTPGTTEDSYDKTSASVDYVVASGVTATIGYTAVDTTDNGSTVDTESNGSAWYIGANISF